MIDLAAIDARHDEAVLVGRKFNTDPLDSKDLYKLFACASDIPDLLVEVSRLQTIIKAIEDSGSLLCNCEEYGEATNPKTGAKMDHHCECRAVLASAAVLGRFKLTRHADQCVHTNDEE